MEAIQHPATIDPSLSYAVHIFLTFKRGEGLTRRSLEWYAGALNQFCAWVAGRGDWPLLATGPGGPSLAAIRPLDIAEWLIHQQDRGLSGMTVEGNYRALLGFFNWCEDAPDAGRSPSPMGHGHHKTVKRPKTDEPSLDFVTFEEYALLTSSIDFSSWIDYRDWSMIGVMFWCGVRRGELLAMQLGDINFTRHEIRIRHSKGRKARIIFLLDDLFAGIHRYLELRPKWQGGPEGTPLWLAFDKARVGIAGALSTTGLRLMLLRRCKRAGVRFLNPHLFRHGFAMTYLNHGADLKAVGTLLGHSSYKTTEKHYAQWIDGPLREVHRLTAARIAGDRTG